MPGLTSIVGKYKIVYYLGTFPTTLRVYDEINITRFVWCEFSTTASTLRTRRDDVDTTTLTHCVRGERENTARTEVSTLHKASLKPIQIFSIDKTVCVSVCVRVCVCVCMSHLCGHQDRWVGQFVVSVHPEREEDDGGDGHDGDQWVHQSRHHWRRRCHWFVCRYGNREGDKTLKSIYKVTTTEKTENSSLLVII